MLRNTLRDLQWRKRRFAIAIAGTALVFAMTLLLTGLSQGFRTESAKTLRALGAEAWVLPEGSSGPFSSIGVLPESVAEEMSRMPGVRRADPVIGLKQTVRADGPLDANIFGHRPGGLGSPPIVRGRGIRAEGSEAVVDLSMGLEPGQTFTLRQKSFTIVGLTEGMTFNGGAPNVYLNVEDLQGILFGGSDLVTTVLVSGRPSSAPEGYALMTTEQVQADILRPLQKIIRAIDIAQMLLWVVAASIVGSVIYLSALERLRDFAVFKAIGASTTALMGGLVLQAVIVSVVAAVAGAWVAKALVPIFPIALTVPMKATIWLGGVAVVVGMFASLFGLRRAVAVDPARAFGGR